jgi:hypothetical protein
MKGHPWWSCTTGDKSRCRRKFLASDNGKIDGTVCFPSEIIPAMTVYFQNVITNEQVELAIGENQSAFSIQLPPNPVWSPDGQG